MIRRDLSANGFLLYDNSRNVMSIIGFEILMNLDFIVGSTGKRQCAIVKPPMGDAQHNSRFKTAIHGIARSS